MKRLYKRAEQLKQANLTTEEKAIFLRNLALTVGIPAAAGLIFSELQNSKGDEIIKHPAFKKTDPVTVPLPAHAADSGPNKPGAGKTPNLPKLAQDKSFTETAFGPFTGMVPDNVRNPKAWYKTEFGMPITATLASVSFLVAKHIRDKQLAKRRMQEIEMSMKKREKEIEDRFQRLLHNREKISSAGLRKFAYKARKHGEQVTHRQKVASPSLLGFFGLSMPDSKGWNMTVGAVNTAMALLALNGALSGWKQGRNETTVGALEELTKKNPSMFRDNDAYLRFMPR